MCEINSIYVAKRKKNHAKAMKKTNKNVKKKKKLLT